MVCVFGGMATGELVMFQQMGFGLAVAVLIDATIVRTIIVPAAMALLGDWNWYLPRWLQWIPDISVEGRSYEPAAPKESRRPRHEPGITVPRPSLEGAEN
jgi:RND superfamily putative drug exporter